jgi:two-component system, sensor histidine kinase SagS
MHAPQAAIPLLQRLSTKLALWVFGFAVGLGISFSALQIYLDYFNVLGEFDATTEQVLQTLKKPAAQAAYQLDPVLSDEVVQGLFNYAPIYKVQLLDEQDMPLAEDLRPLSSSPWRWLSASLFGSQRYHAIPLRHEEDDHTYGILHAFTDTHVIATGFIERSVVVLLSTMGWTLVLGALIFVLVQTLVNKPLAKMVRALTRIDPAKPDTLLSAPKGHDKDELGRLVHSANNLLSAISEKSQEREQLIKEMESAKQAAEAANIAKSQFIAKMSHELRTPLNAVIGYSEILQEEAADMSVEEIVGDLEKVLQAGRQLLSMVNDVLDISKIESGQTDFHLSRFSILEMAQELLVTVNTWSTEHGNSLDHHFAEDLGEMRGDRAKIIQSLLNLLENACKYTEQGEITFNISRESKLNGDIIVFVIKDTGIGIPPDRQEAIFASFDQADNSYSRAYDGMGLGLAIANGYARMMSGSLSVSSELGKGSVFTLRLPAESGHP